MKLTAPNPTSPPLTRTPLARLNPTTQPQPVNHTAPGQCVCVCVDQGEFQSLNHTQAQSRAKRSTSLMKSTWMCFQRSEALLQRRKHFHHDPVLSLWKPGHLWALLRAHMSMAHATHDDVHRERCVNGLYMNIYKSVKRFCIPCLGRSVSP